MKRHFAQVRHAKPPASRKESSELYVVATASVRVRPERPQPGMGIVTIPRLRVLRPSLCGHRQGHERSRHGAPRHERP